MSFRDSVKSVYSANHHGPLFAEEVQFTPEPGAQPRKLWCSVTPATSDQESDNTQDSIDRFTVQVGRDETDTTRGGVWDLKFNASILRSVSKDPIQIPLYFNGEIVSQSDAFHRVIFTRYRRKAQGRDK